jgi:hypothetical protein
LIRIDETKLGSPYGDPPSLIPQIRDRKLSEDTRQQLKAEADSSVVEIPLEEHAEPVDLVIRV